MPASLPAPRLSPGESGFGVLETLIGMSILAMALLGYVSTNLSHQRLAEDSASRNEVHQAARHFMERMRGDTEWATLYERLRTRQALAEAPGTMGERLDDGRRAFPLTAYYPDIVVPPELGTLLVLVDVPHAPTTPGGLREDVSDPRYGLPADLNGDGVLDGNPRADDYVALPVIATFRWVPRGESARELKLSTGIRGDR